MNTELKNESRTEPGRRLSDPELSSLLRSLPHEQASIGFEERVKRRLHEGAPGSPHSWWSRSVRVAAPLMAAAALGFLFGPEVFRHGGDPAGPAQGAVQAADVDDMQPMDPPRSLAIEPSRTIPSVVRTPQPQAVSAGGPGVVRALPSPRIRQIQQEAARIEQQIEELRRQQNEARPRVLWTTEDGVEVEVDLAELMLMLERGATAALEVGASELPGPSGDLSQPVPAPPSTVSEPPRW